MSSRRKREHSSVEPTNQVKEEDIPQPTMEEIDAFTKVLNSAAKKPAILKITQPYAQAFISKLVTM